MKEDMKFSKDHLWVSVEDGIASIGFTDHAVTSMKSVLFINLPETDSEMTAGEPFGDVESIKTVSDLIAPISGTVTEANESLLDEPEQISEAPYDCWIVKVKISGAVDGLMTEEEYQSFLAEE